MKLNSEWQTQWGTMDIPEEAIHQRLSQVVQQTQQKPKISPYRRARQLIKRRKGWLIGLAAAGVLVFVLPQLSYLSNQSKEVTSYQTTDEAPLEMYDNEAAKSEADSNKASSSMKKQTEEAAEGNEADEAAEGTSLNDSMVAYTYQIDKRTSDFSADSSQLQVLVAKYAGYFDTTSIQQATSYSKAYGYYTIRIPQEQQTAFFKDLQEIGTTVSESSYASNYTDSYQDNESRLAALEAEQTALLDMLEKSETVDDMIKLQDRLSTIRSELERLKGTNHSIEKAVEYITIELTLNEITQSQALEDEPSVGAKIQGSWDRQLQFWKELGQELLVFIGSNIVYLVLLAVGGAGCLYWVKKRKQTKE